MRICVLSVGSHLKILGPMGGEGRRWGGRRGEGVLHVARKKENALPAGMEWGGDGVKWSEGKKCGMEGGGRREGSGVEQQSGGSGV